MKRLFSFLFIIPLVYSCSVAQSPSKYANLITEESSKNHLTILASKEYEGRGTGQKGGKMAAEYIANEFKNYGLKPIVNGNSYYQPLSLVRSIYNAELFDILGKKLIFGKDFSIQGDNKFQSYNTNEIIFVGYGIQDEKYNELKNIDVKNKIIFFINEDEPIDDKGNSIITGKSSKSNWSTSRFKRIQELSKLNPKMIITTSSTAASTIKRFNNRNLTGQVFLSTEKNSDTKPIQNIPVITILPEIADQILAKANSSISDFKITASKGVQTPFAIKAELNASIGMQLDNLSDPNVIGFLEGTDKKDEIVVIGGHYDHDGILPDGTIFPGADDNGSGTVGVLELAKAFAKAKSEGKGSKRSILFIAFAAEEKGLLGSTFYSENPILPLNKTVACINVDMIGRIDDMHLEGDPNYIHVIGVNKLSTDLKPIVESANKDYNLNLDYGYDHPDEPMRLYYRSDHYNFAKHGIPSLFFFSGLHPHYHTTEDTFDKINFPIMVKREKLIFNVAWDIANRDKKLIVDLSLEDAKGSGR